MASTRKPAPKKTAKNRSHKTKRAVVDELRWAIVDATGRTVVYPRAWLKKTVSPSAVDGDRLIRVRITEVTK